MLSAEDREALTAAVRSCRVDDGAPVALIRPDDVHHVTHMVSVAVEQIVARHVAAALNDAADMVDATCRDWEPWTDGRNRTPEVMSAVAAFQQTRDEIRRRIPPT